MPRPFPAPADEDWQVVSPEWWRIPFNAVSWAYSPTDPQDIAASTVTQSPRVAKPPHYHAAFIRAASVDDQHEGDFAEGDDELNSDLVGFKGAVAAVESYEIDVGFHWPLAQIEEKSRPDLTRALDEDHVALAKERWDEVVQDLTGGLSIGSTDQYHESDDDSLRGLHRSTSTHSSIDLTDSERSVLSVSMPATPRGPRSYANIVVKNASPSRSASSRDSNRSPRRLNAAASSFVPSPSKVQTASDPKPFLALPEPMSFPSLNAPRTPSPTFNTTFVFPSLNVPPLPAVKITKDEQGFYSEVESAGPAPAHARTSSTLLPAFLHDAFTRRRPPASKTRAIVDRLKSSGSGASQEPVKSQPARPPQLELSALAKPRLSVSEYGGDGDSHAFDDDEGWIDGDDSAIKTATVNPKTRRTRDLFLALTRRRSNSSPPKPTLIEPATDDVVGITVELPSPASSSSNDGWIEGPALLLPQPKAKPTLVHLPERKSTPVTAQILEPKPLTHRPAPPRTPKKAKRSTPAPVLQASPPGPPLYVRPPPPYYYPHAHPHAPPSMAGPYAAAAYMHQMQVLQMQQQQQMHMRHVSAPVVVPIHTPRGSMSSTGSGEWFPYAVPVAAYPVPALHSQPVFVPRG
ncbi:hypothetical protein C8R44DRAFT_136982 [Mycena epipterygia]|nr:hypothetical protein C8R44DRAFT_136982 [Mycena epipterygia]